MRSDVLSCFPNAGFDPIHRIPPFQPNYPPPASSFPAPSMFYPTQPWMMPPPHFLYHGPAVGGGSFPPGGYIRGPKFPASNPPSSSSHRSMNLNPSAIPFTPLQVV